MLRIAEEWHKTDVGRQRSGNEDSYFVRVPLFAVADGMGGAQAGEVASGEAVKAFEPGLADAGDPINGLVAIIDAANERIHAMAAEESRYAGMGTTCTAAYLTETDELVVAHVGDSRGYLYRDGELTRLTQDHSLVGELIRRGRLTEEEAEQHPQRSVITRALGADATVKVDVDAFTMKAGDVVMLCSDGLTAMVTEANLAAMFQVEVPLAELGRGLIDAANEAGGRDNITVVLFRLEELEGAAPVDEQATASVPVIAAADTAEEAAAEDPDASGAAQEPPTPPRRTAPLPLSTPPPHVGVERAVPPTARRRRHFPRALVVALIVLAPVLIGGWIASRAVFFVGTDTVDHRTVAIFRGLPYELPAGLHLYQRYARSGVTLDAIPAARRKQFTDHKLRSRDDAAGLVRAAELGKLEPR